MTNQEAIKRIKEHIEIHKYRESHAMYIVEALEMAISALQAQELSETQKELDTISRQAAIDAIGKTSDKLYENIKKGATFPQRQWFDGMAQAQSILDNLPSVTPKRKTGRWILHPEQKNVYGGKCIECPECGDKHMVPYIEDEKFCRSCGADMRSWT